MNRLHLDQVWELLPPLEELRPVLDFLARASTPDPDRTWTGAGELDTVATRLVPGELASENAERLAREAQAHLAALFRGIGTVLSAEAAGDREGVAKALMELAELEETGHRPDRAEAWASAALNVARGLRRQEHASLAMRRRARYLRALGRLDEAREGYEEGARVARDLNDVRGRAEALIGAGNVLEEQGRWADAEGRYHQALEALAPAASGAPERWQALLNLHIVTRSQGRLEEADAYLAEAMEVARASEDASALPFLENARGQRLMVSRAYDRAESHFRFALESAPTPTARVVIGLNLAEALLAQGRDLDAAEIARRAEVEAISAGLLTRLPEVYRLLGRITAGGGNSDAFVLFERSLAMIRERGLPSIEEARTLQAYAEAEGRHGDRETAAELHRQATALYAELGIQHPRDPWSEFFAQGPATDDAFPDSAGTDHA